MFRMFARELLTRTRTLRESPPSALLGAEGVRAAMREGGQVDGRTAAGYLYHSARISRTIAGAKRCVDLGCGTGVQLLQLAALNPDIEFVGVDRVESMLVEGERNARDMALANVSWLCDDIVTPHHLQEADFDAAISTMALHDLPDAAALAACFRNLLALLRPGGAIYIEDFARLRTRASMDFFAAMNAPPRPDAFSALYRASLGAAFTADELRAAARLLAGTRVHATFLVPFLMVVKTPDRAPLGADVRARLQVLRSGLTRVQRHDLDELQKFFALGGWFGDPFA